MNIEELSYHGAHFTGGAMGFYQGLSQSGLRSALIGLLVGLLVGWAFCFFPFLMARACEERVQAGWARVWWRLGIFAPVLAPLVMVLWV